MSEGTLQINVRATDEATKEIASIKGNVISAAEEMADANERLEASTANVTKTFSVNKRELASAIGIITSTAMTAVNLYQQFDRLQDMQLKVSQSSLALEKAQNRVADIQAKLNKLEAEGKKGTEEYDKTLRDLQLAQETAAVASERLGQAQENVSERYLTFGLTVVPTVINMVMGLAGAQEALKNVQIALNAAMAANPIGLIVVAIGLLIGALVVAYQTCEPFRNAVNAIGEALSKTLQPAIAWLGEKMTWLWKNVIVPVIDVLKGLWDTITGNPILAALFGPITSIAYIIGHWKEVTEALGGALNWLHNSVIKPVADKLLWFYNTVLKPIRDIIGGVVSAIGGAGAAVGAAITGGGKTTAKAGATMVPIPKGTFIVEHRSPVAITSFEQYRLKGLGGRIPITHLTGFEQYRRAGLVTAPSTAPSAAPTIHITAAPSVTVQITGAIQPAVVPAITREIKKATYEGVSEALRDGLRRKGVPIWRGY